MRGHRTRTWIVGLAAAAAAVLLLQGAAEACQAPATAEVSCAPDLAHWQATVTITNEARVDYTMLDASLDTTRWYAGAALTGFRAGTVVHPGATLVGRATGIPLSTAGATITYTGHYADGRTETDTFTLGRPVLSCDDTTTTTVAPTTTTTTAQAPTTVPPSTVAPTTTTSVVATTAATTTPPTIGGKVIGTTTTTGAEVLGEVLETTTTQPALAATGAGSSGSIALGGLLLVLVGAALVLAVRRPAA